MKNKFVEWYNGKGRDFFLKNGVKPGFRIMEFGAGGGVYTVPLARAAGCKGVVFAAEFNHSVYDELKNRLKEYSLSNVEIYDTGGRIELNTKQRFDYFVLFDVVHYYGKDDRALLYSLACRSLWEKGILSVFPKHCKGDSMPQGDFGKLGKEEIKAEIEKHGFVFDKEADEEIIHDNSFGVEKVLNFIKE